MTYVEQRISARLGKDKLNEFLKIYNSDSSSHYLKPICFTLNELMDIFVLYEALHNDRATTTNQQGAGCSPEALWVRACDMMLARSV